MYDPNDTVAISATDEYDYRNVPRRSVVLPGPALAEGCEPGGWSRFLAGLLHALGAWST